MTETTKSRFAALNSAGHGPIFDVRAAMGYSRSQMASALGMSENGLRNAEHRGGTPRGDFAAALLALALNLPTDKITPDIETFIVANRELYNQLHAIFGASDN